MSLCTNSQHQRRVPQGISQPELKFTAWKAQAFLLQHGGPGVLQALAAAAARPPASDPALANALLSRGPALSMPLDRCVPQRLSLIDISEPNPKPKSA